MKAKPVLKLGFSLIELMVVMGISALLLVSVGLSVFYAQRNNLILEQVSQELSAEMRLVHSKIIGIQNIEGRTPKAAVIHLQTNANPVIKYIEKNASGSCVYMPASTEKTFDVMPRARISNISNGENLYLVSITPTGKFYASASLPDFLPGSNNSCVPAGSIISNTTLIVVLTNESRDYYIKIDSNNGAITPTPNL